MRQNTIIAFICALTLAPACGGGEAETPAADEAPSEAEVPIRTTPLLAGDAFVTARLPAVATPLSDGAVAIASPCEGRVVAIRVNEGDAVVAGAPLAEIACLDAGVLTAREAGQGQRIRALDRRARELKALRVDGLVDIQRVVDIERELLTARTELVETQALIARAGLGARGDDGATITLVAPQDGVVAHVGAGAGNLIDRVGMPVVTVNRLTTTRVEADLFAEPRPDEIFHFRSPGGRSVPLRVVSVRPVTRDPDDLTSTRLRLSLELMESEVESLRVGTRGHVDVVRDDPTCRALPAHAVQRRPRPDGVSEFCVFAAAAPDVCLTVAIWPGDADALLVCGASLPGAGTSMRAYAPSWTTEPEPESAVDAPAAGAASK